MLIAELKLLFGEVLNPVSSQAILRVKIPEGLDLDAWIGPEMEEPSSDYSVCDRSDSANFGFFLLTF